MKSKRKAKARSPDTTLLNLRKTEEAVATRERVEEFARTQTEWLRRRNENLEQQRLEQKSKKEEEECLGMRTPRMSKRSYSLKSRRSLNSRQ